MYVKCTAQEWSNVEGRISKLFEARHMSASDWMNYGMSQAEFESRCYESVFPATEQALVNQLGKKHFDSYKELAIAIKTESGTSRYKLTFTEPRFMSSRWHNHYPRTDYCVVTDPAILDIARRRHAALTALANEKSAFIDKVKTMWEQAPSINALIKVWPPITDFLSHDVIERVNRKVERNRTEKMALEVGDLSVHLLKAKVAA